ncbi:MAG: hypothetical protein FJW20_05115 [Acidimicrobiia bacterium]|nr:hypothetical protein [Acidimicrobiia bacterium]
MESGGFWNGLKRFIWWDYPRASWQYDVMVGLILAFIFLVPRGVFRDQPKPKNIVMVPAEHGASVFYVEPELLSGLKHSDWNDAVSNLVHSQAGGKNRVVSRVEPVFDEEKEIRGYMVYTKP